jgi:transcriptional regulator of arginine metabolism
MTETSRLEALAQIIRERDINNQVDLQKALGDMGFETTQSSISRNLRKLGVHKSEGCYRLPTIAPGESRLVEFLEAVVAGDNLIVLRGSPGSGQNIAFEIDRAKVPEVVGTIAGDDTVFVAIRNAQDQTRAIKKIYSLFH